MEIFSIPIKHVNCYVIKIQDFYVAIDAGWAGCINEYLKELHLNNIDPRQIKYLFITHFHPDHAGLAENFKQYGTRLVLFTHQTPYIPFMEKMISPNSSYMPLNQQTSLVLALEDSDSFFTEHRIPAQAFKTTGHSEDSITLIFQDGSAFIGDLYPPNLIMDDDVKSKESWNLLLKMGAKVVYPAHGASYRMDY